MKFSCSFSVSKLVDFLVDDCCEVDRLEPPLDLELFVEPLL